EAARRANYINAHLALEKGTSWIERGDIGRGLLWLLRALETVPKDAEELEHSLRMLLGTWGRRVPQIRTLFAHTGDVHDMALSPDGTFLVIAGTKTAQLWETATGRPMGAPLSHQPAIGAVAVSPDNKTVATAGYDGTARLWDVTTSRPVGEPLRLGEPAYGAIGVAFCPDAKRRLLATP